MRRVLLAGGAILAMISSASAKDYQLPEANPAVAFTLPESWEPSDIDAGVEATSPDQETYIAVETSFGKPDSALIDEDFDFLKENKVVIDQGSRKTETSTLNGLPVTFYHWDGKDSDGLSSITIVSVKVTDKLTTLITAWSSPAGDKANGPEISKLLSSLKKL